MNVRFTAILPLLLSVMTVCLAEETQSDEHPPIVRMPPFVVSGVREGLPWKYARVADFEVLTLCPERLTEEFVRAKYLGSLFVPEPFRAKRSTPAAIVLFNQGSGAPAPAEAVPEGPRWASNVVGLAGTIENTDRDSWIATANLSKLSEWAPVSISYGVILLKESSPGPPPWLEEGLFGDFGVFCSIMGFPGKNYVRLPKMVWGNEEETDAVRYYPRKLPELVPLDQFFNQPPPDKQKEPDKYRWWCSQAGLFVRWWMCGQKVADRNPAAFWKFADQARHAPINEPFFKECFHQDYATASKRMLAYLRSAMSSGDEFDVTDFPRLPELKLRPATEVEVARLKGNWERLEARRLRADFPKLAQDYEDAARRTLQRGLRLGGPDPKLLSVLGQFEYETGHPAEARPHLEAAAAAKAAGSRALLALARLRLAEERGHLSADGKLSTVQLDLVLTPLFAARARPPAMREVYQLIGEVWAQSAVPPARGNLAVLLEGVQNFPRDPDLIWQAADLHRRFGFNEEAAALAAQGEQVATDPVVRDRFAHLKAVLTPPTAEIHRNPQARDSTSAPWTPHGFARASQLTEADRVYRS